MSMHGVASVLQVEQLNKRFGRNQVLSNLEFQVQASQIHGLIGLNGSGKTTTLNCCLGYQRFQSGSVHVLDRTPDLIYQLQGRLVTLSDTPDVFSNLTVRQNLEYVATLTTDQVREAHDVEEMLDIARYSNFKASKLSLGNRRRLSIAQALLGNPELVVFDEPFNGLDVQGIEDVLAIIAQQNAEFGTTFLLASHQLAYLQRVCSHIAILHAGSIQRSASIDDLLKSDHLDVRIQSNQRNEIAEFVESSSGIDIVDLTTPNEITLRIRSMSSAELNTTLVNAGLAINELVLQSNSLLDVFQEVTRDYTESVA